MNGTGIPSIVSRMIQQQRTAGTESRVDEDIIKSTTGTMYLGESISCKRSFFLTPRETFWKLARTRCVHLYGPFETMN